MDYAQENELCHGSNLQNSHYIIWVLNPSARLFTKNGEVWSNSQVAPQCYEARQRRFPCLHPRFIIDSFGKPFQPPSMA